VLTVSVDPSLCDILHAAAVEAMESKFSVTINNTESTLLLYDEEHESATAESIPDDEKCSESLSVPRNGTSAGAVFNIINGLVGSGILSLSWAFQAMGMTVGITVVVVVALLTLLSLHISMTASFRQGGFRSLQQCIGFYLGTWMRHLTEVFVFFDSTGGCVGYLIICSRFLHTSTVGLFPGLQESVFAFLTTKVMFLFIFSLGIIFPLMLLREIKHLWFVSTISVVCSLYFCGFMVYELINWIAMGSPEAIPQRFLTYFAQVGIAGYPLSVPTLFLGVPLVAFSMTSAVMCYPISYEIKECTSKKYVWISATSYGFTSLLYILTGVCGFLIFGRSILDNVISNFAATNIGALIARMMIGINLLFSYPFVNYNARLMFLTVLYGGKRLKLGTATYILFTLGYLCVCMTLAYLVPNIAIVFGLTGAITTSGMMFFFPGLLSFVVLGGDREKSRRYRICWKIIGVLLMLLWIFIAITGVLAAITRTWGELEKR